MNDRKMRRTGLTLGMSLVFGAMVLSADEVPWKFEGNTNRVAASECMSAEAWADFCACEVAEGVSALPWDNLVRSIWTSAMSEPATIPTYVGSLLFIR